MQKANTRVQEQVNSRKAGCRYLFVYQQFIAFASHVHDADAWVGFETATESGDEYLKAAGVEEVGWGLSFACTEKFEDLCLAW